MKVPPYHFSCPPTWEQLDLGLHTTQHAMNETKRKLRSFNSTTLRTVSKKVCVFLPGINCSAMQYLALQLSALCYKIIRKSSATDWLTLSQLQSQGTVWVSTVAPPLVCVRTHRFCTSIVQPSGGGHEHTHTHTSSALISLIKSNVKITP